MPEKRIGRTAYIFSAICSATHIAYYGMAHAAFGQPGEGVAHAPPAGGIRSSGGVWYFKYFQLAWGNEMFFKLIVAVLGGWLVVFGWDEFSLAYNNSVPAKMTCSSFIADQNKPRWVSVEDCVMYLGRFEYSHNKHSDKINRAGVLLYPNRKDAETGSVKTSVVIQVSDGALMETASKNIDSINATNKKIDDIVARLNGKGLSEKDRSALITEGHALEKEAARMQEQLFVMRPMVFKFSSSRPEYNLLKESLAAEYSVYEISSADDKPSYFMGLLKMIGGLALIVGVVYSFIPGRKKAG